MSASIARSWLRTLLLILLGFVAVAALAAALALRPDRAALVATGLVSHTLCSETFVAGLDPAETFTEVFSAMPVIRRFVPFLRWSVDRSRKEVTTTLAGRFERRAV